MSEWQRPTVIPAFTVPSKPAPAAGNWRAATLASLRCPKCDAMNLKPPAAQTIEIDERGQASCNGCGHGWSTR